MRNIYIMANGRTGSSFLSGHFSTIDNDEGLESNHEDLLVSNFS